MNKQRLIIKLLLLAMAPAIGSGFTVRASETNPQDEAVTKTAEAFVEAFNKGDARAVSEFWTPDGDYVDEDARVLKGRKAIEGSFADLFSKNKDLKLRIEVAARKFPTPDTAIEDGNSIVSAPDGRAPSRSRYTNVLVKKDGKWLLESVREAAYAAPSNYEYLRPLDFLIGEWAGGSADGKVVGRVVFEWGPGKNFIVATRTMEHQDAVMQNGTQWIGWDPAAKQIRSWNFEGDGGFSEATWSQEGDKWVIKTNSTVVDGSKVTGVNTATVVDGDTIKIKTTDQKLDGKPLPDGEEITVKRVD